MHMTALQAETERNRLDRSARCAEKRRRRAGMLRVYGPIRPTWDVRATTDAARGGKRLISRRSQAILTSEGRPLWEFRLKTTLATGHAFHITPKPKGILIMRIGLIFAVLLGLSTNYSSAEVTYVENYDEFTEKDNSHVVITPSSSDLLLIAWKCFSDGLNVVLAHQYLSGDKDDDVVVMYKFDDEPASSRKWYGLAPGNKITVFDMGDVNDFTKKALASQKFIIRVIDPLDNDTITATFEPRGLSDELHKLRCR